MADNKIDEIVDNKDNCQSLPTEPGLYWAKLDGYEWFNCSNSR